MVCVWRTEPPLPTPHARTRCCAQLTFFFAPPSAASGAVNVFSATCTATANMYVTALKGVRRAAIAATASLPTRAGPLLAAAVATAAMTSFKVLK